MCVCVCVCVSWRKCSLSLSDWHWGSVVWGRVDGWDGRVSAGPRGVALSPCCCRFMVLNKHLHTGCQDPSQRLIKTFHWNPCEVADPPTLRQQPAAANSIPLHTAKYTVCAIGAGGGWWGAIYMYYTCSGMESRTDIHIFQLQTSSYATMNHSWADIFGLD